MPVIPGPEPAPLTLSGPCQPWIAGADLGCADGVDVEVADEAAARATERLWALSGRRFGPSCPVTIRPCLGTACHLTWLQRAHRPTYTLGCAQPGALIDLGVVYSVDVVTIDGAVFADWVLDSSRLLRRTDGYHWPLAQDMDVDETSIGSFAVTVRAGLPVPVGGVAAARALACEIILARTNPTRCRLPARTRTASAQGTTVELVDLTDPINDGLTGLSEVDQWIAEVNPHRLASRSTVMSPDLPRHIRR